MRPPRAVFLEIATTFLILTTPVVKLVPRPNPTCAGDSQIVHAEVNPKNRSVLGCCLCRRVDLHVCCAADVKLPLIVLSVEFRTGNRVVVGEQVLLVWRVRRVLGQHVVGFDSPVYCGEAHVLVVEGGRP